MKDDTMHPFFSALFAGLIGLGQVGSTTSVFADSPSGWSQFHGPGGRGYVAEGELPSSWTDAEYAWRRDLGTQDVGSPVTAGGKVFYLSSQPSEHRIAVEAVDLISGDLLWSKAYAQSPHHLHARNTLASSTPAADDTHVFFAWSEPQHTYLKCFDHQGNEIWSRDFGTWQSQHGFGTSPRIFGDMVLLLNSQQATHLRPGQVAGESRMLAVDYHSGETKWKTPLKTTRSCYGVPAIYQSGDDPAQVIGANTGNGLFGLDAATGEMLWQTAVFRQRCCSTPLIVGDIAIGSSGSGGGGNHLVAVRIPSHNASGQSSGNSSPQRAGSADNAPRELYRIEKAAPYVPTPAITDNLMFMVADSGIASCVDVKTGEVHWAKRIGGNFGASPIVIGDQLLLINLDGEATVLRASSAYQQLGEIDLGGPVSATPAYANGRLILRVGSELRCLIADHGLTTEHD